MITSATGIYYTSTCLSWKQGLSRNIWPQRLTWAIFDFQPFRSLLRSCMNVHTKVPFPWYDEYLLIWFEFFHMKEWTSMSQKSPVQVYVGFTAMFVSGSLWFCFIFSKFGTHLALTWTFLSALAIDVAPLMVLQHHTQNKTGLIASICKFLDRHNP